MQIEYRVINSISPKVLKRDLKKFFLKKIGRLLVGAYTMIILLVKVHCLISPAATRPSLSFEMGPT